MKNTNNLLWTAIFLFIIGLTQSNLFIDYETAPSWFGLPQWIWWFILFHILFIIALSFFVKTSDKQPDNQ